MTKKEMIEKNDPRKKKPRGPIQTKRPWLIRLLISIAGGIMWRHLDRASKDAKKAQQKVLMDIINYAKDTVYGKEHGFSEIKTIEDYQKRVPINTYDSLKPYILRHTKGEPDVLFPGKPVIYATTSGTTKEPKWIPITRKYWKETYNGMTKLWFYSLYKENPRIFDGPDLTIIGRAVEGYTEDGTIYGAFSGQSYKHVPGFMSSLKVIPKEVHDLKDYYSRYYCLLRFTLMYQIRMLITGNPSTLLELHRTVERDFEELVSDIENGTLKKDLDIPDDMRIEIEKHLTPNPERAKVLRELKSKHSPLYPKHYWPYLQVVNTWRCGNSGRYLEHTKDFYPDDTQVREFSYLATEARCGIILFNDQIPSIMACHLLLFEFIKASEMNDPNPRIYQPHELEIGEHYYIIVTTPSGLYRYNMNDILRMDDWYNNFPMLTFVQKGEGITSLTGEKLHEAQFLEAIETVCKEKQITLNFQVGFAHFDTSAYHLFSEFTEEISPEKTEEFRQAVDDKLREINIEYEAKRNGNRIKPLQIHKLIPNAWDKFKANCMAKGMRDGQFKLTHLMIDDNRMKMFQELELK